MPTRQAEQTGATWEAPRQIEVVRPICLVVEHISPPVPSVNFDWQVFDDDRPEEGCCFGPTRDAALQQFYEVREMWEMVHATPDELEQLALVRLEKEDAALTGGTPSLRTGDLASVEAHLLTCPECAERARETAEFVEAFHDASLEIRSAE